MNIFVKPFKLILVIFLTLMISACGIHHNKNDQKLYLAAWKNHQQELTTITSFQASGSMVYYSNKTRYLGRFFINQVAPHEYQFKLLTPMGSPMFSLTVTPYLAELTDSSGQKYQDINVSRLMNQLTKIDIPINTLTNWLIGYSDDASNDVINSSGLLSKTKLLQQNQEWNLTIDKYTSAITASKEIELPATIVLVKQDDKLRITVNNWKLN